MKTILRPFVMLLPSLFLLSVGCSSNNSPTAANPNDWEEVTAHAAFAGRYGLTGTVYNNLMWVVGGASGSGGVTTYYSDVWSSGDGASWSKTNGGAPFGGRYGSQVLSFNGKLWLIGGNNSGILKNDVWNSTDGAAWTQVLAAGPASPTQFSAREDFQALVFNGLMWVIGGWSGQNNGDVWSSPDGFTWTKVFAGGGVGGFAGRWGLTSAILNNQIWIFGGASGLTGDSDPTQGYGDAWFSATGAAWTKATQYAGYGLIYFGQTVSMGSELWMTAGFRWNNWGGQSQVATSGDGINWTDGVGSFPPRFYHLSLVYNNYVWIIAGADDYCDTTTACPVQYLNDVWRHQ